MRDQQNIRWRGLELTDSPQYEELPIRDSGGIYIPAELARWKEEAAIKNFGLTIDQIIAQGGLGWHHTLSLLQGQDMTAFLLWTANDCHRYIMEAAMLYEKRLRDKPKKKATSKPYGDRSFKG